MTEIKELATIALNNRIWVWPDHEKADDANAGTFDRPLKTYDVAKSRAEREDIIIVVPAVKELFRERYLQDGS